MDQLRVGIVGSKFAASLHAECYHRTNKVEIVAATALDNLEEFAKRFHIPHTYEDFHGMMERDDIDAVIECVPNFLHHDVTIAPTEAKEDYL
jgi:predicted dehydrogenase